MRPALVLVLLLAPLGLAHPVDLGNHLVMRVHLVDATSGKVHHYVDHQTQAGSVNPQAEPLLANRSYLVVVELEQHGMPVDGRVGFAMNGTQRFVATTGGAATIPLGRPPPGFFYFQAMALPAGWQSSTWERYDWVALPSTGPSEPDVLDRWGLASLPEWRTYEWTAERAGFGKFALSYDDVGSGPGGFLTLLHYALPSGTSAYYYIWSAYEGPHAARLHVAYGGIEAGEQVEAPVFLPAGARLTAQGDWPAGAVVTVTQGVLNPTYASAFFAEVEADAGVFTMRQAAAGAMAAYGAPSFSGGTQVTATAYGRGESIRDAREAEIALASNGTVLISAFVGESVGTYAWRYAGEEVTARFANGARFWRMTGGCAGLWWLHVTAARFGDESLVLLHLTDHAFPPLVDATFTDPVGSSSCRRDP